MPVASTEAERKCQALRQEIQRLDAALVGGRARGPGSSHRNDPEATVGPIHTADTPKAEVP